MSAFFDSNVLVYALDKSEALKHMRATALVAEHVTAGTLVLSTQVLQETYSVLTTKKAQTPKNALAGLRHLAREKVVPSSADFVLRALELAQDAQLSVWDALIVRAALDTQCDTLFSEDLQTGRRYGELQVINPFLASAHEGVQGYATTPAKRASRKAPSRRMR